MDKKELQQHYFELERRFEANKEKRSIKTILAFAVAFFAVLYVVDKPNNIFEIIANIGLSVLWSWIHFLINASIFGQLCDVSKAENKILEGIRKQLNE